MKGVFEINFVNYFVDFDKLVLFINEIYFISEVLEVFENIVVWI